MTKRNNSSKLEKEANDNEHILGYALFSVVNVVAGLTFGFSEMISSLKQNRPMSSNFVYFSLGYAFAQIPYLFYLAQKSIGKRLNVEKEQKAYSSQI